MSYRRKCIECGHLSEPIGGEVCPACAAVQSLRGFCVGRAEECGSECETTCLNPPVPIPPALPVPAHPAPSPDPGAPDVKLALRSRLYWAAVVCFLISFPMPAFTLGRGYASDSGLVCAKYALGVTFSWEFAQDPLGSFRSMRFWYCTGFNVANFAMAATIVLIPTLFRVRLIPERLKAVQAICLAHVFSWILVRFVEIRGGGTLGLGYFLWLASMIMMAKYTGALDLARRANYREGLRRAVAKVKDLLPKK